MRDFRNAKAMAKTLRESLAERAFPISHSESLELIAHVLGSKNWQTLSAVIEADARQPTGAAPVAPPVPPSRLPVIPMRDIVVFPEMTVPLFAGRPKTLRAIERAVTGDKRLFLVTQRRKDDEAPGAEGLHEVGVVAQVLQTQRLPDGTMKVVVQAERRARLLLLHDGELMEAQIQPVEAPPADEASLALARQTLDRFAAYAGFDPATPPIAMTRVPYMASHPGAFADLVAPHVAAQLEQAQELLATADPAARLEKLLALMGEGGRKAA